MERSFASRLYKSLIALSLSVFIVSCGSDNDKKVEKQPVGFIYTTTNGEGINQVMQLSRYDDGTLGNEKVYSTSGKGGANVGAGGDAHGDFDSQGAVQIIGDYLLATNAGGNSISVFKLNRSTGDLAFMQSVGSGGERPVSIGFTKKTESEDEYWVVVGNQWNNPNIQKSGDDIERYPNNAFFEGDLTAADPSDAVRNIVLFSFDSSNGALVRDDGDFMDSYNRENGGPTTVTFSDDGTRLAVATWGIAHFSTDTPLLAEQKPSRVYVYNFDAENGEVSNVRHFEKEGVAGTIGINFAKGVNDVIHASNFNLINSLSDHGLTVLKVADTEVTMMESGNTGEANQHDEACWTVLNPDGTRLYVSSFGANVVTPFSINTDGSMNKTLPYEARGDNTPSGDTKEMWVSPDDKYVYVLGAFQTFTLNRFKVTEDGLDYLDQYIYEETKDARGDDSAGKYNFLGLTGFDIK
ncbi:beta-propeller fold lactonase family protein [Parashewanella tropica]|uniref:beta-propeller fold lactonase family protein n=1 Tax=Parashewanella tropica TaxID=2547970 RepID=UPI0010596B91|nr:beta-propeller fold lactonase family protein [Parashewanella tropica]